jgi:hypothetical protein
MSPAAIGLRLIGGAVSGDPIELIVEADQLACDTTRPPASPEADPAIKS